LSAEGAPALKRGPVQVDEGCVLNATLAISVAALAVGFAALFGPASRLRLTHPPRATEKK
jgi:hypothetical protein